MSESQSLQPTQSNMDKLKEYCNKLNEEDYTTSLNIANQITQIMSCPAQIQQSTDKLREIYIKNIMKDNWKSLFEEAGKIMVEEKLGFELKENPLCTNFTVAFNGIFQEFDSSKIVIMIGRKNGCDILLGDENLDRMYSRLHLMILRLPSIEKFFIIDLGGIFGFEILDRSNKNAELVKSIFKKRAIATCDINETVITSLNIKLNIMNMNCSY